MKSNTKVIIFYVVLIAAIVLLSTTLFQNMEDEPYVYSDIVSLFEKEQVKEFEVKTDNTIIIKTQDDKTLTFVLRDLNMFYNDCSELYKEQHKAGIIVDYHFEEPEAPLPWWVSFLPYIIIIALGIFGWMYVMRQMTGGKGGKINSFSKARTKLGSDEKIKVTFDDVAGSYEEKEELEEVVEFLKNPGKFQDLGAKIPRGVLLVGPPGTGKTLLAKAVAGEAGVPFFSISGSDFVEMYVGVGASRVRDLFETAKKSSPSIVFIDEIDAVGRHRGAGLGGGHDEREQTLNQLLVEMDGFGRNDGVIIMAATNRPDILDPALLRPGRFDRQVIVDYPDMNEREEILKVHSRGKPFEESVSLKNLAKTTAGFTGADLSNILNEAALLAARRGKKLIGNDEIEDATIKVIVGPQKKSKVVVEKERKLTAFHEAGHAIVTRLLPTQDDVHQISIIPRGRAGGYTLSLPSQDKSYMSKSEMEEEIVVLLGGRVAEALVLKDISTGASNDIQRASQFARDMVTRYGMSAVLGPIVYGTGHTEVFLGRDFSESKNYSEKTAALIDEEVMRVVDEAYKKAEKLLLENIDKLNFVAEFLMKNEVMDGEQFALAMSKDDVTIEEIEEIGKRKSDKSKEENEKQEEKAKKMAEEAMKAEKEAKKAAEEAKTEETDSEK